MDLVRQWVIHLRAERKSPNTVAAYRTGVELFLRWAAAEGVVPELDRRTVVAWVAHLNDTGQAATAALRLTALRQFSAWLVDEDELPKDEIRNLKPPRIDQRVVEALTPDEVVAFMKACAGKDFLHRRDEAIARVMRDTGCRASECVDLDLDDVDTDRGSVIIRRGKGGKGRMVPIGPKTCQAIERYLRLRRAHPMADSPALWLSATRLRRLSYDGLYDALLARARQAGISGFHPHRLRHTMATAWLDAGGSEGGLMAMGGWSRRDMLDRYTKDSAERRAAEEFRRLDQGDY